MERIEKHEIYRLIEERVEAIKNKDIDKATENYSTDVILFDIIGSLQQTGVEDLKDRLSEWLESLAVIEDYEIVNVEIQCSESVGYCSCFNHLSAVTTNKSRVDLWWRETAGYSKTANGWKITHVHNSVPFDEESGGALINLKPG